MSDYKPRKITRGAYLQMVGLKALADSHMAFLSDINDEMKRISGEPTDPSMHIGDCVYGDQSLDKTLEKMHITVSKRKG